MDTVDYLLKLTTNVVISENFASIVFYLFFYVILTFIIRGSSSLNM